VAIRRQLAESFPDDLGDRCSLAKTLNNLGLNQGRRGHLAEGEATLHEAVRQARVAFDRRPDIRDYRQTLNNAYGTLGEVLRAAGKLPEAVSATLERQVLWPDNAFEQYRVARDLARAAQAVGRGKSNLSGAERAEREKYVQMALEALRHAVGSGYRDREALRTEPAWKELQHREDFLRVLNSSPSPQPTTRK
jgi:hypothetical protein